MSGIIRSGGSSLVVPAEFSNVTGRTFAQMQAGVEIATAASDEVLRLRDVTITQTVPRPWRLRLGSTPLLSGSGSTRLTGDEIVVPGAPLTLDTQAIPFLNRLSSLDGSNHRNITTQTIFNSDRDVTALTGTFLQQNLSPGPAVTPNFSCIGANGDFFYASPSSISSNTFYRRAGGINGAETSPAGGAWATFCYDGSRYIYLIGQNAIREYDTQTATLGPNVSYNGALTNFAMSNSVIHHSAALDRYVVHRSEPGNNNAVYLINPLTGLVTVVHPGFGSGTRHSVGFNRLTNGSYVCTIGAQGTLHVINLGPNLASPLVSTLLPSLTITDNDGPFNGIIPIPGARNIVLRMANTTAQHFAFDLDTGARILNNAASGTLYNTTVSSWFLRPLDATIAGTDFGTADARVTGERFRV